MQPSRLLGVILLLGITVPGHAFFNIKNLFSKPKETHYTPKAHLPGQETKAFKLRKGKASDIAIPIQNYLNGLKTMGSVQVRETDNSIIVTDLPENLAQLSGLIPDIDQVYAHDNAQAREMMITQNLMKAVRSRRLVNVAARPSQANAPAAKAAEPVRPEERWVPAARPISMAPKSDAEEIQQEPTRRIIEQPSIQGFQVIGWLKDRQGYVVILSNQGQRFTYRNGRVHSGYRLNNKSVDGMSGRIQNQVLTLINSQGRVSLKMLKWREP